MCKFIVFHKNGCYCEDWGESKQEVLSHYRKSQILKIYCIGEIKNVRNY